MFGEHGHHLTRLANAVDERSVDASRERKSVSHEDTYSADLEGREEIRRHLLSQSTRVADRLVAKGLKGRRIQLKIRDTDFKTETRQCTLAQPTDQGRQIYDAVCQLLDAVSITGRRFRLTGVGVSGFSDAAAGGARQLDLLATASESEVRGQNIQDVMSAVRSRFGHAALYPAEAGAGERRGSAGAVTKTIEDDER